MTLPFLRTKLNIPALRRGALERPSLLKILDYGADGRMILVTAPAGYGKTTLVTQWLLQQDLPICWLSLDSEDDEPSRFFNLLMAALHQKFSEFEPIPFPQQYTDHGLVQAALRGLMNDLAELNRPLIIALDDYHEITHKVVHNALDYLIEGLPPGILVVMISRERPTLSLPRWRARGWLTELTQAELKFDHEQAGRFLRGTMNLSVANDVVELVSNRVDGWVTGLQFTGLKLQKSGSDDAFLQSLSKDKVDHYSADYLLAEVLDREPIETQDFLLKTSVLNRLSGELCNAILDIRDGQSRIENLEARNLFTLPLDDHREWYRYHPVMADLLRIRLGQDKAKGLIDDLHRKAALWYEQNELLEEAIPHAFTADDLDLAAKLLLKLKTGILWQEGGVRKIASWLASLPQHYLIDYPYLGIMAVGSNLVRGEFSNTVYLLEMLEGKEEIEGEWHGIQGNIKRNEGKIDEALEYLNVAYKELNHDDPSWTIMVYLQMIMCYREKGNLGAAKVLIREATEVFSRYEKPSVFATTMLSWFQGVFTLIEGDYTRGRDFFERGLSLINEAPIDQRSIKGYLLTGLSDIHYSLNELDAAEMYAEQALEIGRRTGISDMMIGGLNCLCDVALARKDRKQVPELLDEIQAFVQRSRFKPFEQMFHLYKLKAQMVLGDFKPVFDWADRIEFANAAELSLIDRGIYILWAKSKLLKASGLQDGKGESIFAQIARFSERLVGLAQTGPDFYFELTSRLIWAEALDKLGEVEKSTQQLKLAIEMGEHSGVMQPFMEFHELIGRHAARLNDVHRPFVQRIIPGEQVDQPSIGAMHPDLEVEIELTNREQDMLQALADGLSNKEIETRLFISRNTVRTHLRNLYSKLDVSSRTQAVLKAQEMGLV